MTKNEKQNLLQGDEIDTAGKLAGEMRGQAITFKLGFPAEDAFMVVAALQLAWRHPGLNLRQRTTIERFARILQEGFGHLPITAMVLEHGWSREHDTQRSRIIKPGGS